MTNKFTKIEKQDIILPLKNLISESYALDISRKCKSVQRQNIRDGRFVGRMAPYGYDKDPQDCRHLVVDPDAAAVVCRIFDWAAQGMGGGEIGQIGYFLFPCRAKRRVRHDFPNGDERPTPTAGKQVRVTCGL